MLNKEPRIFDYLDFKTYLADAFEYRKQKNPRFSLRSFSGKVNLPASNSSFIPAVLKGRKRLTEGFRLPFARALELGEKETHYFDNLVQFNQAQDMEGKNYFFSILSSFRGSKAKLIKEGQLKFVSKWYYPVIWNYFGLDQKTNSAAAIAQRLSPPVSPAEVEEAIKLLLDLGLIKRMANGYAISEKHLATEPEVGDLALNQTIRQLGALALEALPRTPQQQRLYNSMLFTTSTRSFEIIKERVKSFKEELRQIIDQDKDESQVMVFNLQIFPVAQTGR